MQFFSNRFFEHFSEWFFGGFLEFLFWRKWCFFLRDSNLRVLKWFKKNQKNKNSQFIWLIALTNFFRFRTIDFSNFIFLFTHGDFWIFIGLEIFGIIKKIIIFSDVNKSLNIVFKSKNTGSSFTIICKIIKKRDEKNANEFLFEDSNPRIRLFLRI
jgi:hypothetical protein